jgi:hypothetical protein
MCQSFYGIFGGLIAAVCRRYDIGGRCESIARIPNQSIRIRVHLKTAALAAIARDAIGLYDDVAQRIPEKMCSPV